MEQTQKKTLMISDDKHTDRPELVFFKLKNKKNHGYQLFVVVIDDFCSQVEHNFLQQSDMRQQTKYLTDTRHTHTHSLFSDSSATVRLLMIRWNTGVLFLAPQQQSLLNLFYIFSQLTNIQQKQLTARVSFL